MVGSEQSRTYTFNRRSDGTPKWWPIIFKSVELALCILCLCVIDDPAQNFRIRLIVSGRIIALSYGTIVTFLIVSAIYLFGKFLDDDWPWRTQSMLSATATVLFFFCGVWLLKDYAYISQRNFYVPIPIIEERSGHSAEFTNALLLVSGISLVITAITHAVETVLTVWVGRK